MRKGSSWEHHQGWMFPQRTSWRSRWGLAQPLSPVSVTQDRLVVQSSVWPQVNELTYWQFVVPSEMTFGTTKGRKVCNVITHNVIWTIRTVCISLATHTCNVWRNMLTSFCGSIGCHFKHSEDMLILRLATGW